MITNLLVGLNGTSYTPAVIAQATDLVQGHGCHVTATTFLGQPPSTDSVFAGTGSLSALFASLDRQTDAMMEAIESRAVELQALCRRRGRHFRIGRISGDPVTAVQAQSRFNDLSVFGPGGWSELDAVDDPLEHLRDLTLAGVHPVLCASARYEPIERVLFCLRPSPISCASWRHFLQLKPWPSAVVTVLVIGGERDFSRIFAEEAVALGQAHGLTVEPAPVPDGAVVEVIIDQAAARDCQAIAIGPSGRSGVVKRFLGDVGTDLVGRGTHPVLILD